MAREVRIWLYFKDEDSSSIEPISKVITLLMRGSEFPPVVLCPAKPSSVRAELRHF